MKSLIGKGALRAPFHGCVWKVRDAFSFTMRPEEFVFSENGEVDSVSNWTFRNMLFWVFVIYNRSTNVGRVGKGNAHTGVRNAGVGNTLLCTPLQSNLRMRGSQTKLSYFDFAACNAWQRPDHFHVRPRPPPCILNHQIFVNTGDFLTDFWGAPVFS